VQALQIVDGLYATMTGAKPVPRRSLAADQLLARQVQTKFNEDATVFSIYGYYAIDAFARAAAKAGPALTTDSFMK
jgi:branched-chain amino acid transport system substrate-binding protein